MVIKHHPRPITKKDQSVIFGTTGYHSRFIPQYALHSVLLTDTTKKSAPDTVVWTSELIDEFSYLSNTLSSSSSLVIPNDDIILLQIDASLRGVGAVVSVCRDSQELPVAFYSKKLLPAETHLPQSLAMVRDIVHFAVYLVGRTFTVEIDHSALKFLMTSTHLNARLTRRASSSRRTCLLSGTGQGRSTSMWMASLVKLGSARTPDIFKTGVMSGLRLEHFKQHLNIPHLYI